MSFRSLYAAEVVNSNDDVLTEILLWLPAKSLIRFKSVSKHWLFLISADQFGRLHTLRHTKPPQPPLLIEMFTYGYFYLDPILNCENLIPYSFNICNGNPKIWSFCNGLLLLQPLLQTYYHTREELFVYNPTTKQSRNITLSLTNSDEYPNANVVALNLAFDPSKSLHYKIVCVRISGLNDDNSCQVEVYASESHTWELCSEPFTFPMRPDFYSGVYYNNVIYWTCYDLSCFFFDIDKRVTGSLIYPEAALQGALFRFHLQELNGYLYYVATDVQLNAVVLAICRLQELSSQWVLTYYDVFDEVELDRGFRYCILILDGRHNGEICTLMIHTPGKIITYSTLDKSSVELDWTNHSCYHDDLLFDSWLVHKFGESLVPV